MNNLDTQRMRLDDDARFELAAAAGARERQNRPVWMVGAAALLLAVVVILSAVGITSRSRAVADLRRNLADQAQVERMVAEWQLLNQMEVQTGGRDVGAPDPNLRSTLEALATRAGFKSPPFTPTENTEAHGAIRARRYMYFGVKEQSLGAILEWLRLATQDPQMRIPGLEVESLTLKPENNTWSFNLTLRRWERAS